MRTCFKSVLASAVCALAVLGGTALPAQGAAPEPVFVLTAPIVDVEGKTLELEDVCGIAPKAAHNFYLANYYLNTVDWIQTSNPQSPVLPLRVGTLLAQVDPLDGPCGLALDGLGRIYVNNYHRNVERYSLSGGTFQTPAVIDSSHPTGVAVNPATNDVYLTARTYLAAYDSSGAPLMDGPNPLKIGVGSLGDGYGLAISQFPATLGRLYVPDHSDDTVKVYDPLIDKANPVQTITGPPGGFGSLRDSAVAVDRVSGEVYVADTIAHPQYKERPEAVIRVFTAAGTYKGRLKYAIVDPEPPGLAVDNIAGATQGRVYVASGNSVRSGVYVYPPNSATSESAPGLFALKAATEGQGQGQVQSTPAGLACADSCQDTFWPHTEVTLTATPQQGSAFTGWSGGGCSGTGKCTVEMSEAHSVRASFEPLLGPSASSSTSATATQSVIAQQGTLRVSVAGKLAPKRLPREGAAPISVSVGGEISTTDQSLPPQLDSMRIELNREGKLDSTGLPPCPYNAIQPGSSSRALSACRDSLVGEGSFTANITLAGQQPYPTKGKLLVFHSVEKGKPVLYGHIYSAKPFATSFVIVFSVQKLAKGTYGTALDAPLPAAMDAWGRLTGLQMTLARRYSFRGKARSFISAGCPAPKGFTMVSFPLVRTEFAFDGGKRLSSVLSSVCRVG